MNHLEIMVDGGTRHPYVKDKEESNKVFYFCSDYLDLTFRRTSVHTGGVCRQGHRATLRQTSSSHTLRGAVEKLCEWVRARTSGLYPEISRVQAYGRKGLNKDTHVSSVLSHREGVGREGGGGGGARGWWCDRLGLIVKFSLRVCSQNQLSQNNNNNDDDTVTAAAAAAAATTTTSTTTSTYVDDDDDDDNNNNRIVRR